MICAISGPLDFALTFEADDPESAIDEAIEAIGVSALHGAPTVARHADHAIIRYPTGGEYRLTLPVDHQSAAGEACADDGTGMCRGCGVALTTCGVCGGIGYHSANCRESEDFSPMIRFTIRASIHWVQNGRKATSELPAFELACQSHSDVQKLARQILPDHRPAVWHTGTIADGNGNSWDLTDGRKIAHGGLVIAK